MTDLIWTLAQFTRGDNNAISEGLNNTTFEFENCMKDLESIFSFYPGATYQFYTPALNELKRVDARFKEVVEKMENEAVVKGIIE